MIDALAETLVDGVEDVLGVALEDELEDGAVERGTLELVELEVDVPAVERMVDEVMAGKRM